MMKQLRYSIMFIWAVSTLFKVHLLSAQKKTFKVDLITKETKPLDSSATLNINDVNPFIRVYLPSKEAATGRGIVICPGGGYAMVATDHEGFRWAGYFNHQGIAAIVLKYRLPQGDYKKPIGDAEEALKIIKDSASKWNINPDDVGIMGFSAGGHLASSIATHIKPPQLIPKFQVLFYPVITMDSAYSHLGSRNNFLGKDSVGVLETYFSNEKQVTDSTPRLLLCWPVMIKWCPRPMGLTISWP